MSAASVRTLSTVLLLAAVAVPVHGSESAQMTAVVSALEEGDYGPRAEFASVALEELIASYQEVLEGPGARAPSLGGKADLRRWKAATAGFVAQLQEARWRLERGADVRLSMGPDGTVMLFVDRQPVLVNGPDAPRTQILQRSLLTRFCSVHPCDSYGALGTVAAGETQWQPRVAAADAHWSFTQDQRPRYVTASGMHFVFADLGNREQKERLSLQLADELLRLAEALRAAAGQGQRVDWQAVQVLPRRDGSLEQVRLNGYGERLDVSVPLLAANPVLWREVLPWLHAQVQGEARELVVWQAGDLLRDAGSRSTWLGARR